MAGMQVTSAEDTTFVAVLTGPLVHVLEYMLRTVVRPPTLEEERSYYTGFCVLFSLAPTHTQPYRVKRRRHALISIVPPALDGGLFLFPFALALQAR